MLYVNEIMQLSLFNNFHLIAGKKGMNRSLNYVVILEYESIIDTFDVFSPDHFVLTSLFFAKDNTALISEALCKLINIGVAGIAVKTLFFDHLPQDVIDLANSKNVPIFTFENAYMEDLIICVNEFLKEKQQYLINEKAINDLINTAPSEYQIEKTAHDINPKFSPYIISAYITPRNTSPNDSITSYFNRLLYIKYQHATPNNYSYVKYKNGMLLIYSYEDSSKQYSFQKTFYQLLKNIDINPELFYMGISNPLHTLKEFNTCIEEGLHAHEICRLQNAHCINYSSVGIYRYIFPLMKDHSAFSLYHQVITTLMDYDAQYSSNLLETLTAYVQHNGEISATATALFQHPNTIRYRISKAKYLLKSLINEATFYEEMNLILHMHLLQQSIQSAPSQKRRP